MVGAGFTGLAAARRLAEHDAGARIVLIEAQRVGNGASGRNSGFVVDLGCYEEHFGREDNQRLLRLGQAGLLRLRQLVQQHKIDCGWNEWGRLHVAASDRAMRSLEAFCRSMEGLGEPCEVLEADAVAALTGTTYYRAGARRQGTALVQPAALVRGLAAALPGNVELFEQSPVHGIRLGPRIQLDCADGSVIADEVLLATNAYTPLLGFGKCRVFPMLTFASLTRPLRGEEQAALGPHTEWGLVSAERVGSSVRRLPNGRLLIRNTACYGHRLRHADRQLRRIGEIHRASLGARFPALRDVELEYTWGGVMGMSANGAPFFGRVRSGVLAVTGDNGHGIALGTAAGALMADLAVGCPSELLCDIQQLPAPAWVPPNPLLRIGVQVTTRFLQWRARREL